MTARRFRDVVAWDTLVAPGVVACKDGSLLAAWEVVGIDTGQVRLEEQQAFRGELARGLSTLKGGETIWTVWRRRPWKPEPVLALREGARGPGDDALDALAVETNATFSEEGLVWVDDFTLWLHAPPEGPLDAALRAFESRRRLIEGWADPVLGLIRVDAPRNAARAEIVSRLAALAGAPRPEPRLRALPIGIDALIAPDLRQPRADGPILTPEGSLAVMTVTGQFEDYAPSPLEPLQSLPLAFSWITRYGALSPSQARTRLFWKRKELKQSAADFAANIEGSSTGDRSQYADRLVAETETTRETIERGVEGHGDYLCVLTVAAPQGESLAPAVQTLREATQQSGFVLRHEGAGALATYLAALPGHGHPVPRAVMTRAATLCDCIPVRGLWPGSPACPSPLLPPGTPALLPAMTSAGTLHHFNLHVGDVGHTLVFGPTGTGKSVLLGHLAAAWLRYPGGQVIAFDRGRSLRYATAALGGLWLEPGTAGAGVAPLSHMARLGTTWALAWVSEMMRRGLGHRPDPDAIRELGAAIAHLAASSRPTLDGLRDLIQDRVLRTVLDGWITGPRAGAFESKSALDVGAALAGTRLAVFETEPLMDAEEDVTVLALDYIFAEVAARFDGRPTLIVIDEAWKLLNHAIFADRLRSWLKEGRKKNVAVLMATQSVGDAARAAITADLVESCPTRLYLANPTAATASQAPDYAELGLSADRIDAVAVLRRKRQALLVQDDTARVLSFPLGPFSLSILGRTSSEESARVAARAAENPRFWSADLEAVRDVA